MNLLQQFIRNSGSKNILLPEKCLEHLIQAAGKGMLWFRMVLGREELPLDDGNHNLYLIRKSQKPYSITSRKPETKVILY